MLFGDGGQGLKRKGLGLSIEYGIARVADQSRDGDESLIVAQHGGLRQTASSVLSHHRGWIVVHRVEQGRDGCGGSHQSQTFDGPTARIFVILVVAVTVPVSGGILAGIVQV